VLIYNYTEDKLTWDERATKLLISSYAAKKDQFRNPKLKKKRFMDEYQVTISG
jgi:hypothetical protein